MRCKKILTCKPHKDMVSEGKRVVLVTHSGRKEISRAAIEARLVNFVIADYVPAKSLIEEM